MAFKERFGTDVLISTIDWSGETAVPRLQTGDQTTLYNALIGYWYYSEIGFSDDDMFIQRLNTYWDLYVDKYTTLLEADRKFPGMYNGGGYTDTVTPNITITDNNNVVRTPNLESDSTSKGRNVEIQNFNTASTGTETTVTDKENKRSGTETTEREDSRTIEYNTGDEIEKAKANTAILYDFCRQFDKLFMEVL